MVHPVVYASLCTRVVTPCGICLPVYPGSMYTLWYMPLCVPGGNEAQRAFPPKVIPVSLLAVSSTPVINSRFTVGGCCPALLPVLSRFTVGRQFHTLGLIPVSLLADVRHSVHTARHCSGPRLLANVRHKVDNPGFPGRTKVSQINIPESGESQDMRQAE